MALLAVIAIAALGSSIVQSNKATKATIKAAETESKQTAVSNRRERIKALAKGRVVRAKQASIAEVSGTSAGSGSAVAQGAAQSETFANIGFQQQLEGLNNRRVGFLNSATAYSARAATYGKIASFASGAGGGSGSVGQDIGKFIKQGSFGYT